jgi:hypothetical protein
LRPTVPFVRNDRKKIESGSAYRVTGIAVCRAAGIVNPAPIGVHGNRSRLLGAATTGSAFLPRQRGMGLSRQRASLLGTNGRHNGREKERVLIHLRKILKGVNLKT